MAVFVCFMNSLQRLESDKAIAYLYSSTDCYSLTIKLLLYGYIYSIARHVH